MYNCRKVQYIQVLNLIALTTLAAAAQLNVFKVETCSPSTGEKKPALLTSQICFVLCNLTPERTDVRETARESENFLLCPPLLLLVQLQNFREEVGGKADELTMLIIRSL